MKFYNEDDVKLLKKARMRLNASFILIFAALCAGWLAMVWVLSLPWMQTSLSLDSSLIISILIQVAMWLGIFFWCSSEQPASRKGVLAGAIVEATFGLALIVWSFFSLFTRYPCIVWGILQLLMADGLYEYGKWLEKSDWARIFFDKTVRVYQKPSQTYRDDSIPPSSTFVNQKPDFESRQADFSDEAGPEIPKQTPLPTYPLLALRIGICVYTELFVFPIITEVFKSFFVSTDKQYSFATTTMFTLCIISAVLWTVAIFFLYLREPKSRLAVMACIAGEILSALWCCWKLYTLSQNPEIVYRWSVFAGFGLLDIIRLLFLAKIVSPVFEIPAPAYRETDLWPQEEWEDMEPEEESDSEDPF